MTGKRSLRETEVAVLDVVQMRENATAPEIAREVGITSSKARRIVDSLLQRGILHRHIHIDVYRLGYYEVDLLVKFKNNSAEFAEKFIQFCVNNDKVSFLSEAGGTKDLRIGLVVRSPQEVHEFVEAACERFNHPFAEKLILPIMQLFIFGAPKGRGDWESRTIRFGFTNDIYTPSPLDLEILKRLSREPNLSAHALAQKIGVPSSTLSYRIQRLEDRGVIAGYRHLLDPHGKVIEHFHALVSLGGVSSAAREAVHTWCVAHPNVPLYGEVHGDADFFVCITVNRSIGAIQVSRSLHQILEPFNPRIELYPSPTLRKLVKYPFN
jgi:DNA-binding Lrp family transcriptional regulator